MSATPDDEYHCWTDAPPCPKCKSPVATPYDADGCATGFVVERGPDLLQCHACGHHWTEKDAAVVAHAWWSAGANQARQVLEDKPTVKRAAELAQKAIATLEANKGAKWIAAPLGDPLRDVRLALEEIASFA